MLRSAQSNRPSINEHPDRIKTNAKYTYGINNINIYYWPQGNYNKKCEPVDECFLEIGEFCSISGHILVYLGGNHHHEWVSQYPFGHIHQDKFNKFDGKGQPWTKGGVKIGNDVWIGTDVTIHSGVTIGDGAVIASNTVVTKDVAPYAIVGGNPQTHIKYRFERPVIKALQKSEWWNMSDAHINELTPFLCSQDIQGFLKRVEELKNGTGPESDQWLETNFLM